MRFLSFLSAAVLAIIPSLALAETNKNAFTAPLRDDIVTVGQSFQIRWINPDGGIINLVLVRGDPNNLQTVRSIIVGYENLGYFNWAVPADLPPRGDYAIEIQSGAERNFTPLFTIVGNPYLSASPGLVEKVTTSNVLIESYPIDPTTATTSTATQTLIVESETLIFPTATTYTVDASSAIAFSGLIYPTTLSTTINGTAITYTTNGTVTSATETGSPTGESVANTRSISVVASYAVLMALVAILVQ